MNSAPDWNRTFREDLAADAGIERGLFIKELVILATIVLLIALRRLL